MIDLNQAADITLQALGDALDLKDSATEKHSKRVTAFAIAISRDLVLARERIAVIARGAFLHDIGKLGIPDAILAKPGALTVEEFVIVREHAYRGYEITRRIPFFVEPSEIVYAHHEHFDGTGYPRGLKGNEIPLGARIVAVANTLDAITSNRPYHASRPLAAARDEIQKFSGSQFDPEIVTVFQQMPDKILIRAQPADLTAKLRSMRAEIKSNWQEHTNQHSPPWFRY